MVQCSGRNVNLVVVVDKKCSECYSLIMKSRREWMMQEGTMRSVLTGHAVIDHVETMSWEVPDVVGRTDLSHWPIASANKELLRDAGPRGYGFACLIAELSKDLEARTNKPAELARFMSKPDEPQQFHFHKGVADQDFTWHFAGFMAMQVAYAFEDSVLTAPGSINKATLTDWADIIGSQWFSNLMHDMAVTSNGVYKRLGRDIEDYKHNALQHSEIGEEVNCPEDLLVIKLSSDTHSGTDELPTTVGPTADLSPKARHKLRKNLRECNRPEGWEANSSIGCPVARKKFEVSDDPDDAIHFEVLALRGLASIKEKNTKLVVEQELTPIDRYLLNLSTILVDIDRKIGTPEVDENGYISYLHVPQSQCFAWDNE